MIEKRKAQFYLIAAIIIAAVIFSLVAISNYAKPRQEISEVFNLGDMINVETGSVINYAYYNQEDSSKYIENFTNIVLNSQQGNVENFFVVYGDTSGITVLSFSNSSTGDVSLEAGGTSVSVNTQTITTERKDLPGSNVTISLSGVNYNFDVKQNKKFAFLIKQGGYVSQN